MRLLLLVCMVVMLATHLPIMWLWCLVTGRDFYEEWRKVDYF